MKIPVLLATLVLSTSTFAQVYGNPGYDSIPENIVGPGITHTQDVTGIVIDIAEPLYKNYVVGKKCGSSSVLIPQANQGTFTPGAIVQPNDPKVEKTGPISTAPGVTDCQVVFEKRLVAYQYVAQYDHIQVRGVMRRMPVIGEHIVISVRSTFWATNL